MNATASVRSTCKSVVSKAKYVKINEKAIVTFAESLYKTGKNIVHWDEGDMHFTDGTNLTAQYVFVMDALNFCFWPTKGLEYEHLAKGLRSAIQKNKSAFDAENLIKVTEEDINSWFHPHVVPLISERKRLVNELGIGLKKHFNGKASNVVEKSGNSAVEMVNLITAFFPGFRDSSVYRGEQVFFYKRAQILVGDVWAAYGRNKDMFPDIGELTMFADYRVPQVLREYDILQYSDALAATVDNEIELQFGCEEESELRAATVIAVEKLCDALNAIQQADEDDKTEKTALLKAIELDWILWQMGESALDKLKPPHHIRTIFY